MDNFTISRKTLKQLIENTMKYQALLDYGVREWSRFYDALSEIFPEPVDDYEDYSEFAEVIIRIMEEENSNASC